MLSLLLFRGILSAAAAMAGASELWPVDPKCLFASACPALDCGSFPRFPVDVDAPLGPSFGVPVGLGPSGLAGSEEATVNRGGFASREDSFETDVGLVEPCSAEDGLDSSCPGEIDCDSARPCGSVGGEVCGVMALGSWDGRRGPSDLASLDPWGVNGGD